MCSEGHDQPALSGLVKLPINHSLFGPFLNQAMEAPNYAQAKQRHIMHFTATSDMKLVRLGRWVKRTRSTSPFDKGRERDNLDISRILKRS